MITIDDVSVPPEDWLLEPEALGAALQQCESAGLPVASIFEGTYIFEHWRIPGLQFRVGEYDLVTYPDRVIQACKSAGILTDPRVPEAAEPPVVE